MEKELEEYIKSIDLKEVINPQFVIGIVKQVFKDAYLLGAKSTLEFMPFYADTEDEDVWDELYAKQLAEGKLTEINK